MRYLYDTSQSMRVDAKVIEWNSWFEIRRSKAFIENIENVDKASFIIDEFEIEKYITDK